MQSVSLSLGSILSLAQTATTIVMVNIVHFVQQTVSVCKLLYMTMLIFYTNLQAKENVLLPLKSLQT